MQHYQYILPFTIIEVENNGRKRRNPGGENKLICVETLAYSEDKTLDLGTETPKSLREEKNLNQ